MQWTICFLDELSPDIVDDLELEIARVVSEQGMIHRSEHGAGIVRGVISDLVVSVGNSAVIYGVLAALRDFIRRHKTRITLERKSGDRIVLESKGDHLWDVEGIAEFLKSGGDGEQQTSNQ